MDEERRKRYHTKFAVIEKRLGNVEDLLTGFKDENKRLACYKAFQEVVEGMTDIISMILADRKIVVEDDYTNIDKFKELKIFDEDTAKIVKEANGLRNRVIHHYNDTDDSIAEESIHELLPNLEKIKEILENEFKKIK